MKKLLFILFTFLSVYCFGQGSPVTLQFRAPNPGISPSDSVFYHYTGQSGPGSYFVPTVAIRNFNFGHPTAGTQVVTDSSGFIATTAFVKRYAWTHRTVVDTNYFRLDTVHGLQWKIIAGTGITISGDTIKSTGGGGLANPSGLLTFTVTNGSSTSGARADGLHAIDSNTVASRARLSTYLTKAQIVAGYAPIFSGTGYSKYTSGALSYITAIPNADLANPSISGVALGNTLFAHSPGFGLTGSNYDGHNAQTWVADTTSALKGKAGFLTDYNNLKALIAIKANSLIPTSVKTSSYTIAVNDYVPTNSTSGTVALTLPTTPANSSIVGIKMVIQGSTNTTTITTGGSDVFNKSGGGTVLTLSLLNQGVLLQYNSGIWYVLSDDLSLAQLDLRYAPFGGAGTNIYNTNGTLTGTRLLTNSTFGLHISDSISANVKAYVSPTGGSLVCFGTSITFSRAYSTPTAAALGLTEINFGSSGAPVEHRTPFQSNDFVTRMTTLPTYASLSNTRYLIIETGPNDVFGGFGANYTAANFSTDLTTVVNYCTGTLGWPANRILLFDNSFVDPSKYTGGITFASYYAFRAAAHNVAITAGTLYLDIFTTLAAKGGTLNLLDTEHPNTAGGLVMTNEIVNLLATPQVVYKGQKGISANGATFTGLNMVTPYLLKDSSLMVGMDANGNFGQLTTLPSNIKTTDNLYLTGKLISYLATPPLSVTLGAQDWQLYSNKIYATLQGIPSVFTTTTLVDATDGGYIFNKQAQGATSPIAKFSTTATNTQILENGTILSTNFLSAQNNGFGFKYTGAQGGWFFPFDNNGNTNLTNIYTSGSIIFNTSRGSSTTATEAARFQTSGNLTLGTTFDSGFQFENVGTSRFRSSVGFGIIPAIVMNVPTTSSTGGTLTAASYYYKVVAIDAFGNIGAWSNEVGVTVSSGTTNSNTITWTGSALAVGGYRIYQGPIGAQTKYITAPAGATSVTDIGSGYTILAPPISGFNTTYLAQVSATGVASFTSVITRASTVAINSTATATAAQMAAGYITSTSAAATTITLPTATALATQLGATQGVSYQFTIDNTAGANTVTLALGSGFTQLTAITGANTLTIASGTAGVGTWLVNFVSPTAANISRIQ